MNNQKSDEKILQVKNLQTWFWTDAGIVKAVDGDVGLAGKDVAI